MATEDSGEGPARYARRPWEVGPDRPPPPPGLAPPSAASSPWPGPGDDDGPVLTVTLGHEDDVAGGRLWGEAQRPPAGLRSALGGGFLMLMAVTMIRYMGEGRWKSRFPEGLSLLAILGAILLFAGLSWLLATRVMPRLWRWLLARQMRRMLRPSAGGRPGAADGEGPTRITLGERFLRQEAPGATRRFSTGLLRGLLEDRQHLVLRFGFASHIVLPRRDLSAAQEQALRDWVARHAREGSGP
jgi:hypothetical protein